MPVTTAMPAMAEVQQVVRGPGGGLRIVEPDAGTGLRQCESLHDRDQEAGGLLKQGRAMQVADQQQAVDATLDHAGGLAQLVVEVIPGAGEDEGVAALAQAGLQGGQGADKLLVLDVGDDCADSVEVPERQGPGSTVGDEAELGGGPAARRRACRDGRRRRG